MSTPDSPKANPGPLGLLGFGITTVMLNLHNAGLIGASMMIVAMGFAVGGLAQIIAGILEFKGGNTFAGTAFTAYGCFWWTFILILTNPGKLIGGPDDVALGWYLLFWGLFTVVMFIGTLKHIVSLRIVFALTAVLFLGLSIAHFSGSDAIGTIIGYEGILTGIAAMYCGLGQLLNGEYKKTVVPV